MLTSRGTRTPSETLHTPLTHMTPPTSSVCRFRARTLGCAPRTLAKIRSQARRVKEVLSANADTPIYVESAYGVRERRVGGARGG